MGSVKFGVSIDDDVHDRLGAPDDWGQSRSERIQELIEIGLAVEEVADEVGEELPDSDRGKVAMVRQMFLDAERYRSE